MIVDGKVRDLTDGAGMTLEEIAEREGITRGGVWMCLQSAYRKLSRNPRAIEALRAAARIAEDRRRRGATWLESERESE